MPTTHGLPPFANLTVFNNAEDNTTDSTPRPDSNPLAVYPIWPCELMSMHSPAEQVHVGLNTITVYTGGWVNGNALPIFHPVAVRVGYPADLVMAGWTARLDVCLQPNLVCTQRGGGIESLGATMAVNEMLMQSKEWAVNLFPVWPANLSASFIGMRARGRILVSAAYNATAQRVHGVELWTDSPRQGGVMMRVMHPWQWSQGEKNRRASEGLLHGRPLLRRSAASVADVVVTRRSESSADSHGVEPISVARTSRRCGGRSIPGTSRARRWCASSGEVPPATGTPSTNRSQSSTWTDVDTAAEDERAHQSGVPRACSVLLHSKVTRPRTSSTSPSLRGRLPPLPSLLVLPALVVERQREMLPRAVCHIAFAGLQGSAIF